MNMIINHQDDRFVYTIDKGKHKSGNHFSIFHRNLNHEPLQYRSLFFNNCWYKLSDIEFDGINQLVGFSYGYHHRNSVRVGWKPNYNKEGVIDLYAYWYNMSNKYNYNFITSIKTEQYFNIYFYETNKTIDIQINNVFYSIDFKFPKFKYGYYLYPYFGGKSTAPHDVDIYLNIF